RRPGGVVLAQVEVRRDEQGDGPPFDRHESERAPPHHAALPERDTRQRGGVGGRAERLHARSTTASFGSATSSGSIRPVLCHPQPNRPITGSPMPPST